MSCPLLILEGDSAGKCPPSQSQSRRQFGCQGKVRRVPMYCVFSISWMMFDGSDITRGFRRRQSAHDLGTTYRCTYVFVVTGLNAHYIAGTMQQ